MDFRGIKMTKAGRPLKDTSKRKYRNLTLSDEVFNGLKKIGNGSASQAVTDLYNEKVNADKSHYKRHCGL